MTRGLPVLWLLAGVAAGCTLEEVHPPGTYDAASLPAADVVGNLPQVDGMLPEAPVVDPNEPDVPLDLPAAGFQLATAKQVVRPGQVREHCTEWVVPGTAGTVWNVRALEIAAQPLYLLEIEINVAEPRLQDSSLPLVHHNDCADAKKFSSRLRRIGWSQQGHRWESFPEGRGLQLAAGERVIIQHRYANPFFEWASLGDGTAHAKVNFHTRNTPVVDDTVVFRHELTDIYFQGEDGDTVWVTGECRFPTSVNLLSLSADRNPTATAEVIVERVGVDGTTTDLAYFDGGDSFQSYVSEPLHFAEGEALRFSCPLLYHWFVAIRGLPLTFGELAYDAWCGVVGRAVITGGEGDVPLDCIATRLDAGSRDE